MKNTGRVTELNILHISRTMGQGGAEKIVYQLATGMRERGAKICVASSGGCYVERLKTENISHYQIKDLECKNPFVMIQTFLRLHQIVKCEKTDIVHTHHRMAAVYARILRLFHPKLKLIYTAHNVFYDKKYLTKAALDGASVVAVGNSVKKNLTDFFNIDPKKITMIYNAVVPEITEKQYQNQTLEVWKKQGFSLVGIIGRLSEQKGVDIFLRVIAGLKRKDSSIRGVIIGDGELKEELFRLTHELGIEQEVLFLGYQEHIATLISQLDLIVMPSRWEGFPLLPLEVFAGKKTIVGSDIGGINEIVRNGESGRLIMKDNVQLFTAAVFELLSDNGMRQRLGENGFEYYRRYFSYQKFIEQYFQLYKNVLEEREK